MTVTTVTTVTHYDVSVEQHAMRRSGLLGRGGGMGNALYAIDHDALPHEARTTIALIIQGGPFPYPLKDGTPFGNHFGDLPNGRYLEYTVPTPGVATRGARRIVARRGTGQLFFTACHYERVHASGGTAPDRSAARATDTAAIDAAFRNGFYIVTGMPAELRARVVEAIKKLG